MMLSLFLSLHIGLSVVVMATASGQELVVNGGFESTMSKHQWRCFNCSMATVSSDSHSGRFSLKVTSRHQTGSGPGQKVPVRSGARYRVQLYVKQLNDVSSSLFQEHILRFIYHYAGQHDPQQEGKKVAVRSMIRSVDGWFSMVGFIKVPNATISSAELRLIGAASGINYLVDDASITEIPEVTDWRTQSDQMIDSIRKGDIRVRINLPSSMDPADVSVKIDLKKHDFIFGTLVKDDYILEPRYKGYQDIVYSLFNTATMPSFKWKFDKGTQDQPDFSRAVSALQTLRAHGLKVRAHNLFWGFTKNMPSWVPSLSKQQLNDSIISRLDYVVNITKGQLIHWVVMNELLHGQWYEETFRDPLFTQNLFRRVRALDPYPTLMLNDFRSICMPDITDAYLQQAKQFLANGVPLGALGIQSHFKQEEPPDPTLIKARLDHLAQSGLPLWVSEMNFVEADVHRRADLYETAYRLYFSHPAIHGIMIWGFWDQQGQLPQSALVEGDNYKFNEAGIRVARLLQEEWSTHVSQTLTSRATSMDVRGFKGDYDIVVRVRGVPVKVKSFSLKGSDVTVTIALSGHEGTVTLPPPVSTVVPPSSGGGREVQTTTDSTDANDHTMGTVTSSSSSSLHCVSRWSPRSRRGDDQHVKVSCHQGEVMTGCSSVLKGHDWRKNGEKIEMVQGQPACVAVSGGSARGLHAVAVCCKASGLRCTYRSAGPSPAGSDATVHITCPHPQLPLGCSAWNTHSGVGGVHPSSNTCVASNQDPLAGVYVYGSCCSAPSMFCVTMTSSPSGLGQGDLARVKCDSGYVITSCQAQSSHGKSSGAFIGGSAREVCKAFNGAQLTAGQSGVKAVAVCCKMTQ